MTVTKQGAKATEQDAQVLIIGGGPVGLGLAIDLGQRGVSVIVVERHETLHRVPKGQNMTQRTGEHFRAWGVGNDIRAAAPIPHEYGSAGLTAYGSVLGGYTYDWFRRAAVRPYYFADNERLPQYETENVLRHRAAGLDKVTILYGWTAVDLQNHSDRVSVEISHPEKASRQLTAQYVVGCDGSGSKTRSLAKIAQDIDGHDRRMVLLVFKSPELHKLLGQFPGKSYFNVIDPDLDGYWQFLGRVDLDGTWFFHAPVPAGTTKENFDFAGLLHRVVGAKFDLSFDHIGFWDLRIATAKTYRSGRVFIAGDAAHSHPPYGGFGINTGFEDARNLGWKLAATLAGWGGDALLDSYGDERLPVFRSTADDFIARMIQDDRSFINRYNPSLDRAGFETAWAARASGGNSDVTGFAPHYEGSPIIVGGGDGPPSAVGSHRFTARPGHHLPPPQSGDDQDMFDALGSGFILISVGGEMQVSRDFSDAAAQIGMPLTLLEHPSDSGQNRYEARYILVRPDHFVAWCGDSSGADSAQILRRATAHPPN